MSKFSPHNKLEPRQRESLLLSFFEGLASIKNSEEAAKVFCDLLAPQELEMLAKRLAIACALLDGKSYQVIKKEQKVSTNTIARVNAWLQEAGDGFRLIAKRVRVNLKSYGKDKIFGRSDSWTDLKRRYPMYFWPQAVLEEVIRNANQKQLKRIRETIQKTKNKSSLSRQIDRLVKTNQNFHTL